MPNKPPLTASPHRIKSWKFAPAQRLFFDANIWIAIFASSTIPGDTRTKVYSNALKRAKAAEATIFIDSVVISEFINRSVRLQYNLLTEFGAFTGSFKAFRATPEYEAIALQVAIDCRNILADCKRIESAFASCDIEAELAHFESGQTDWSDQMIVALCRQHNLILVTDDGDFGDSGLTILTRNSAYFARTDSE